MTRWTRTLLLALIGSALLGRAAIATGQPEADPVADGDDVLGPKREEAPPAADASDPGGVDVAVPAEVLVVPAESAAPPVKAKSNLDLWDKVAIETLWYLSSGYGEAGGDGFSSSRIGRGYVTLKFKQSKWFEPRVTFDADQNDDGDWAVRLKYLYGKLKLPRAIGILNEPEVEFGLVHGPWFDYEEHIDNYRMQGTMFIERNKTLNSADAGVTVGGLLGGKLDDAYQKKVSKAYPGEWGSFAFGLYNGGGYHAEEQNRNKVFESRISLRPGGRYLPNLQLSHFGIYGRGNTPAGPDWRLHGVMASFEHQHFVATAQYAMGRGNQKGDKVDAAGDALDLSGYSGFVEAKLPQIDSAVIARYDAFEWDGVESTRLIVGYAYYLMGKSFLLLDYDRTTADDWEAKLTLQVHYP